MRARIAILQHQEDAPAGLVLDSLAARGLSWQTVRLDRGEAPPDRVGVSAAVGLGSDRSADSQGPAWVSTELAWLRRADACGTPILGLCFGAQALAVAPRGGVERARRPERGWISVASERPEAIPRGPWLAWHDDVIRLPRRAELLAHNESGPQAFRLARHLGVQFHPEATPEIVQAWMRAERLGGATHLAGVQRGSPQYARAAAAAGRLFAHFLESAARSAAG